MTKTDRISWSAMFATALVTSEAAIAGCVVPAPLAGIGVGAVLLLGVGYRILSKRLDV